MAETYEDIERNHIADALEQEARTLMSMASRVRCRDFSGDPKVKRLPVASEAPYARPRPAPISPAVKEAVDG